MPRKACTRCGAPALPGSTRCARHPPAPRELRPERNTAEGRRIRRDVLEHATRDTLGRIVCHLCGYAIEDEAELELDHLQPHAAGGAYAAENLAPAHRLCNRRRGRKPLR